MEYVSAWVEKQKMMFVKRPVPHSPCIRTNERREGLFLNGATLMELLYVSCTSCCPSYSSIQSCISFSQHIGDLPLFRLPSIFLSNIIFGFLTSFMSSSSFLSLACPDRWGRQYVCFLPSLCPVYYVVLFQSRLRHISLTRLFPP